MLIAQCECILQVISYICNVSICQFDIDDILRVAEQHSVEELKNSATDQLLSQFKVVFRLSTKVLLSDILYTDHCYYTDICKARSISSQTESEVPVITRWLAL